MNTPPPGSLMQSAQFASTCRALDSSRHTGGDLAARLSWGGVYKSYSRGSDKAITDANGGRGARRP